MSETGAVLVAVVTALVVIAGVTVMFAWLLQRERDEVTAAWRLNRELVARLQAKDPGEYMVWAQPPNGAPPPARAERRLYDETGLLSVPEDDRLED